MVIVPLPVTLSPGTYALIFGSGRFGATGEGFLPKVSGDLPGASYFVGESNHDVGSWIAATEISNARFVVLGSTVPEPSSFILAVIGLTGLAAWGWRRRKHLGTLA